MVITRKLNFSGRCVGSAISWCHFSKPKLASIYTALAGRNVFLPLSVYLRLHSFTSVCIRLLPIAFVSIRLHSFSSVYVRMHPLAFDYFSRNPLASACIRMLPSASVRILLLPFTSACIRILPYISVCLPAPAFGVFDLCIHEQIFT